MINRQQMARNTQDGFIAMTVCLALACVYPVSLVLEALQ